MATEFEKALERAKYSALPLPRANSAPTTVFAFSEGHLHIVRNPHTCLPDPPLATTVDPAVDTIAFTRQFAFELNGLSSFILKVFGIGSAKAELAVMDIASATVQMGGLSHHTIETGALVDYLLAAEPTSCKRDVLDPDHFTILAALEATSFTYTFKTSKGVVVKLTAPQAQGLFQAEATISINVTEDGRIIVNSPRFVGVVTWDGRKIQKELEKARKASLFLRMRAPGPSRRKRTPTALENAISPSVLRARQRASLPRTPAKQARRPSRPKRRVRKKLAKR